jgi:sortase (surface protein transpeptidase)
MSRSRPVRLEIPQLGLSAPFTRLQLDRSGVLVPPPGDNPNLVGWYGNGVTPGERGPAIVAGHVDTRTGPAVFLLLRMLDAGNIVDITRADGTIAAFFVDDVETYSKAGFPNRAVYGDTPDAQLRLITCGGQYDRTRGGYLSNVVVFAHLVSYRKA